VRAFSCPSCGQLVFFHNSVCLRCSSDLAFDPVEATMVVPRPDQVRCVNLGLAACNWLAAGEDHDPELCLSCRLTRTRPDDGDQQAMAAFADAEQQKRRLVFQLLELGLPIEPYDEATDSGLAFDLLSSRFDNVMTGHDDGVITLDLAESDDVHREQVRAQMGEAYRTVLGHLRHEVGHYYWDVMVADSPRDLARFRVLFGDETESYADALDRHYQHGPPADWAERHVSQYATMHPWEDWAETFAHYLHIRDALQTAASFGLAVTGPDIETPDPVDELTAHPSEPEDEHPIADLVADWLALSYALNAMSRSLGNDDLYPFVLAPAVVTKLNFVHRLVRLSR
jgi:hypothetical protein